MKKKNEELINLIEKYCTKEEIEGMEPNEDILLPSDSKNFFLMENAKFRRQIFHGNQEQK